MKCPHCGADNPDNASVCQMCGQMLITVAGGPMPPPAYGPVPPPAKPKSKMLWIVIVVVIAIILIGAVAAFSLVKMPKYEVVSADAVQYPSGEVVFTVEVKNSGKATGSADVVCEVRFSSDDSKFTETLNVVLQPGESHTYTITVDCPASYWYDQTGSWRAYIK